LIISGDDCVSQIPSHPKIMNSSYLFISLFLISGKAIINYLSSDNYLSFLYSKSPNALLKFKLPFTLPSVTNPPAYNILFFSNSSSGLWSLLIFTNYPLELTQHLLSPAFAQYNILSFITITFAVQPANDSSSS